MNPQDQIKTRQMFTQIAEMIDLCADATLEVDTIGEGGYYHRYSEQDMMNACHVFGHVLGNQMIHKMMDEQENMEVGGSRAAEMGNTIHELVLKYTGINTKTYYNDHPTHHPCLPYGALDDPQIPRSTA